MPDPDLEIRVGVDPQFGLKIKGRPRGSRAPPLDPPLLNVITDRFLVRNWVLLYMNEYAKRSAESILILHIPCALFFHDTTGAS